MGTVKQILIGLVGVAFLLGVVPMVTPLGSEAQAVQPNPPGKQAGRFVVLGTGEVLDVTTGLRWQQEPGVAGETVTPCDNGVLCDWQDALDYCAALGGGYRLPEVKELISLVDYSQFNPALPVGHPFSNVQSSSYWSATTIAISPSLAWVVDFGNGFVVNGNKDVDFFVWCAQWLVMGFEDLVI